MVISTEINDKNQKNYLSAKKQIPGGVNSPVRAFEAVGRTPSFIKNAYKDSIFMMLMAMNLLIMYVRGDPEYSGMHIRRL